MRDQKNTRSRTRRAGATISAVRSGFNGANAVGCTDLGYGGAKVQLSVVFGENSSDFHYTSSIAENPTLRWTTRAKSCDKCTFEAERVFCVYPPRIPSALACAPQRFFGEAGVGQSQISLV